MTPPTRITGRSWIGCCNLSCRVWLPAPRGWTTGQDPAPTTSVMLAERDFRVTNYDPFFAPQSEALQRQYDFITCTETVEHFARPAEEFAQLAALLRPGGWLGVMTQMVESDEAFPAWWCHRDPTHVCFYGAAAMQWIARRHGWRIESPAANVVLFQDGGGAVDSSCAIRVT